MGSLILALFHHGRRSTECGTPFNNIVTLLNWFDKHGATKMEDQEDLVLATLLVQQSAPITGDFQQGSQVHFALGRCEGKLSQLQREPYNEPWQGDKEYFYNDRVVHYLQTSNPSPFPSNGSSSGNGMLLRVTCGRVFFLMGRVTFVT